MPYHETHPLQNEVLRFTADLIKNKIYTKIRDFEIKGFVTPEPIPFSNRKEGDYTTFHVGEVWGKLWDCGWFELQGALTPKDRGKSVVAKIDLSGEALLFDDNGCPIKGLTSVKSRMTYTLGNMGKTVFPLTDCAQGNETFHLILEAGNNDLFGEYRGGTILECGLYECNTKMRDFYYDYAVLYELLSVLPKDRSFYFRVLNVLSQVESKLDTYSDAEIDECRALMAPILQIQSTEVGFDLTALGHAHLDLAWTWPIRETIRKGARTFSSVVYAMQKYPFYKFGASQTQLYAWIKERYPLLFQKIQQLVSQGRWELQGGMWVESDLNVPSGESLVRQLVYGQKFYQENFHKKAKVAWLPDSFGFSGCMPQLFLSAGMKYFVTQKIRTSPHLIEYPHDTFFWEGIDGSRVLTHVAPFENYGSSASPAEVYRTEVRFHDKLTCPSAILLFGQGDGGGGAGYECLECLQRESDLEGLAKTRSRTAEEFFELIEKNSADYQTWCGSMDLDMHTGTLTSSAESKKFNKDTEVRLHVLDWLSTLTDTGLTKDETDKIWEEFLLYQFHDILPGSSINRVYEEDSVRYEKIIQRLNQAIASAKETLRRSVRCGEDELFVMNASPFPQKRIVEKDGRAVSVEVKPYFIGAVQCKEVENELSVSEDVMENSELKIVFAQDGSIQSIFSKKLQREMVQSANKLCVYNDHLHYNDDWGKENAWDFPIRYKNQSPKELKAESVEYRKDVDSVSRKTLYRFNQSVVSQKIVLRAGSSRIDFETDVDWNEKEKMLRSITEPNVYAKSAIRGLQFGYARQNMHKNTKWDYALFENVAQKFVDKSEADFGISIISPYKYGYCMQNGQLDVNLLRSPSYPAVDLDKGKHSFSYSLYIHKGDFYNGKVAEEAYNTEYPLYYENSASEYGTKDCISNNFEIHGNVIAETIKCSEDGTGDVVRVYEANGSHCSAVLETKCRAFETNILEENVTEIERCSKGYVLSFRPFEIKTIKILR